jgi:hypothetical protein
MIRLLVCLTALGLFAALASYSLGKHVSLEWRKPAPVSEGEFVAQKLADYQPRQDRGIAYHTQHDCGEDWLCLLVWANETNPRRKP